HPTILRGMSLPGLTSDSRAPTVLSVTEQDFLPWVMRQLESEAGQRILAQRNTNPAGAVARLYQPVHRAFNVVLLEVACEVEGLPRLDPRKILSAGMTLRRRVEKSEAEPGRPARAAGLYGWMKQEGRVLGWRKIDHTVTSRHAPGPLPGNRAAAKAGKNTKILAKSGIPLADEALWEEDFAPLYPASDALCKALGKTVLMGYLPLTSAERSEADAASAAPFDRDDIAARLPGLLWSDARRAGIDAADRSALPPTGGQLTPAQAGSSSAAIATLTEAARYLAQEPGLFDADPALADGLSELQTALRAIRLPFDNGQRSKSLLEILAQAYVLLVQRDPEASDLELPDRWSSIDPTQESAIVSGILSATSRRWAALSPGSTRFQDLSAEYELQAFVRVDRSDCGCPPRTCWTEAATRFTITPWYEGGPMPPTLVELPNPSDLKGKISPNVAFQVPEEIQQFMSGMKLDKLMEGEQPGKKTGFGMICGFSIPILTICAFIVLQIFLALLHILFWWLPFVRICIPFPKKGG
ncbi:MAG: hypothetical protein ACPGVJ_05095, partial [Mangrovicoccus sp.]